MRTETSFLRVEGIKGIRGEDVYFVEGNRAFCCLHLLIVYFVIRVVGVEWREGLLNLFSITIQDQLFILTPSGIKNRPF